MKTIRVLRTLLLIAMDLPTFEECCVDWCISHNLICVVRQEFKGRVLDLTLTGKKLLNNTVQHFSLALQNFHDSGQLNVKDTNENNDNTNEQKRDGRKGKAGKGRKVKSALDD
jgi:hypothetical protein